MKIASFKLGGAETYGVIDGDAVTDLGKRLGDKYPDLKSLIAGDALGEAKKHTDKDASLADIEFLPVLPNADKILCVGLNYASHIAEMKRDDSDYPVLFTRFADTGVGHEQPMIRPKNSDKFDYEGELAAIIGKTARHVAKKDALGHIAGYTCYNDGSIRDFQRHTHQFIPGKNFPGTGGFGPWMVTTDEIPDPSELHLQTRLNGDVMQDSHTNLLIFDVPFLIEYISSFTELRPGDVIVTGTPGGVGVRREPPVFMKPGDRIEVEITKIGTLANPIEAEK